uniref:Putative secreted protein n=1 Tax=Anopheles darlingi TaxID=43151 RepID=A0A2M4D3X1_ANODA
MIVQLLLLLPQSSADGGPCVSVGIWNFFHSSWSWRRSEPVTVVPRHPLLAAPLAITQNILRPTQRQSGSRTKTHAITFASAIAATCAWRFAVVHGFPGAPRSYNPITAEKAPRRNLIFRKTRNAKKILIF